MTEEQAKAIAAADAATTLLVDCLTRHLEAKGLIDRAEFIEYLDAVADHMEEATLGPTIRIFRSLTAGLRMERPGSSRLQ